MWNWYMGWIPKTSKLIAIEPCLANIKVESPIEIYDNIVFNVYNKFGPQILAKTYFKTQGTKLIWFPKKIWTENLLPMSKREPWVKYRLSRPIFGYKMAQYFRRYPKHQPTFTLNNINVFISSYGIVWSLDTIYRPPTDD